LRLLGNERAETVDCEEIERIREALTRGYVLRPHPIVVAGTRVRVRRGIFESLEGAVTELRRNCKVIISVSALQQCFSLEADLSNIEVLAEVIPVPEKQQLSYTREDRRNRVTRRA
jgi:hypothetical protein